MTLPPVIQRFKAKGISEDDLRSFVRRKIATSDEFHELTSRYSAAFQECAIRLVSLSESDHYWETAPGSENFVDALRVYLDAMLSIEPENDLYVWARVGLHAAGSMSPGLGEKYWLPLVVKDPTNIRWVVETGLFLWRESGRDATVPLLQLLLGVASQVPDFETRLRRFSSEQDSALAMAARLALGVLAGQGLIHHT